MTPKGKVHEANVQRLLTAIEAAKKEVKQWQSDLGFSKSFIRGQPLETAALVTTPERLKAVEQARRRLKELEDEYYAAIGIPRTR